jgi:hypothetical protein
MRDPFGFEGTNAEYRQYTKGEKWAARFIGLLLFVGAYMVFHYFYINWASLSVGGGN